MQMNVRLYADVIMLSLLCSHAGPPSTTSDKRFLLAPLAF